MLRVVLLIVLMCSSRFSYGSECSNNLDQGKLFMMIGNNKYFAGVQDFQTAMQADESTKEGKAVICSKGLSAANLMDDASDNYHKSSVYFIAAGQGCIEEDKSNADALFKQVSKLEATATSISVQIMNNYPSYCK